MAIAMEMLDAQQEAGELVPVEGEFVPQTPEVRLPAQREDLEPHPSVLQGDVDCTDDERAMIDAAYRDVNVMLASQEFRDRVLGMDCTETRGQTSQQIYNLLVQRSPILVHFTMFTGGFRQNHVWHTVGFEDDARPETCFANRHFVSTKEVCASLILHETMHILGFRHDGNKFSSVPYTMNRIYDEAAMALHLA
jgi:hypothetical protein